MKRLCGILLALAGLFLYAPCAAQNTRVRGTVTDAQTGEPIPYAVVLFPGTTTGITTDDEGFYSLESRDTSSYIRAEMVSYEPQIRPIPAGSDNRVDFRLNPTHLEIGNVVVTPGDNPAHPILAGIVRNKKYNDPEEYDRYICRTYTKMELGLANVREFRSRKLQQNFGFIFEHIDTSDVTGQPYLPVMISETAADYYHSRTPTVAREVIRASQISGIEDNSMLAQFTGHLHADVNLYENFIDLFGVKFASPLSNSGRSFYKYFLVDSTNVEGRKTYKIRFHPKSVATPVLDGEVNIDSASYALRSARVKMAKGVNVNWIRHLAIEADNRLTADSLWFPQREKMTADFTLTKSDSSKMIAFLGSREVTYSDVKFDTPIPKQVLGTSANVILSDDAISGKRVEWDSLRPYALSQKEKTIYRMVDSIQQVPLYKNIYTVLNTIIGGYYNTKYVGIGPYSKVISFNRLEGTRFQIGVRTTKEFSRRVRLSTYLAYGTRDEDFKGASEIEVMFRRQLLRKLTVTYRNDAIQLSSGVSALSENNILSSIFSRGGTSRLSTIEEGIALYEHEWLHGISSSFELRGRHISSNRYVPMILPNGRSLHGINDASIRIGLRLSKDETIVRMPFEVRHMGSKYPIFSFDFTGAKKRNLTRQLRLPAARRADAIPAQSASDRLLATHARRRQDLRQGSLPAAEAARRKRHLFLRPLRLLVHEFLRILVGRLDFVLLRTPLQRVPVGPRTAPQKTQLARSLCFQRSLRHSLGPQRRQSSEYESRYALSGRNVIGRTSLPRNRLRHRKHLPFAARGLHLASDASPRRPRTVDPDLHGQFQS